MQCGVVRGSAGEKGIAPEALAGVRCGVKPAETVRVVQAGVIDAISFYSAGRSDVVVDRKGDLTPSDRVLAHYRAQVST